MQLHRITPEQNQLLVKRYWYGDTLSPQELETLGDAELKSAQNIDTAFSQHQVDLYLGTSMRNVAQYERAIEVYESLAANGFTVFAPFFMSSTTRIGQSELEAAMLERASMVVAICNTVDTYGVDSELADGLKQGKPGFIYLAPQRDAEADALQERRYRIFKDVHPRTLIGCGGRRMNGAHVTKDLDTLLRCIRKESSGRLLQVKDDRLVAECYHCGSTIEAFRTRS